MPHHGHEGQSGQFLGSLAVWRNGCRPRGTTGGLCQACARPSADRAALPRFWEEASRPACLATRERPERPEHPAGRPGVSQAKRPNALRLPHPALPRSSRPKTKRNKNPSAFWGSFQLRRRSGAATTSRGGAGLRLADPTMTRLSSPSHPIDSRHRGDPLRPHGPGRDSRRKRSRHLILKRQI